NSSVLIKEVNLPRIILDFINLNNEVMQVVVRIIVALIIWQFTRYFALFFENLYKGKLSENVARKLRIESYDHIQNLTYEYHNNVDSGDLIQRVTSDIEITKDFVTHRLMD